MIQPDLYDHIGGQGDRHEDHFLRMQWMKVFPDLDELQAHLFDLKKQSRRAGRSKKSGRNETQPGALRTDDTIRG